MPWLLKGANALLLVFILAFFVRIVLCLLFLSFIITCFRPFPPVLINILTQTHFNGSGSTLKLLVCAGNSLKTNKCSSGHSDRKASGCFTLTFCYKKKIVASPAAWFKTISLISRHRVSAVHRSCLNGFTAPSFTTRLALNDH